MEKGEWGRRGGEREWGRRGVRREGESVCEGEREGGKKRGREGGGGVCASFVCACQSRLTVRAQSKRDDCSVARVGEHLQ